MVTQHEVRVLEVVHCGGDIVTVRLERPEGYSFAAGQWFRLTIPVEDGADVRTFSHASAPADDWLELTTRLSTSPFKQALAVLRPGDAVHVTPAGGRLTLPSEHGRLGVLVGGVGITPVRSMLRDRVDRGETFEDVALFYGNRDASCEPYLDELLAMRDAGVRVVRVLQEPESGWMGETGFITAAMVRAYLGADDGRPFLVTGPPPMVQAMRSVLDELGVSNHRIVIEAFGTPTS